MLITMSRSVTPGAVPPGDPRMDEMSVADGNGFFVSSLSRLNTLDGLLRVMSYVQRLMATRQSGHVKPTTIPNPLPKPAYIEAEECELALTSWACIVQQRAFRKELEALRDDKPLPRLSRLHRLTPRLWEPDSTLRLRGRLDNS